MSLRLLAGSLLLGSFALIRGLMPVQSSPATEKPYLGPKWEYKALKLDARECSIEPLVANSLSAAGEQGWELVSYERFEPVSQRRRRHAPDPARSQWPRS